MRFPRSLRNDGGKSSHPKELKRHSRVIQVNLVAVAYFVLDVESLAVLKRFERFREAGDAIRRPVPSQLNYDGICYVFWQAGTS